MTGMEDATASPSAGVREARSGRAWTQAHLAEVAGIDVRTVRRIEAGKDVDPGSFAAVAEALGIGPVPAAGIAVAIAGPGSPLLRYVASVERVEGLWTCTDVPAWLALKGWDEASFARTVADWDEASDAQDATGFLACMAFMAVPVVCIPAFMLLRHLVGPDVGEALGDSLAAVMLACAGLVWLVMSTRERVTRKTRSRLTEAEATMREARRLAGRVHVLGPKGATTFEVAATGRLRRTFVPVEAMGHVSDALSGDGRVSVAVTVGGVAHVFEHLPDSDGVRDVADGWRRAVDGFSRGEEAA